jgi:surfeit locus 1 family protein
MRARAWMPAVAACAGIALTLTLGIWQVGRGNQKSELASRMKSAQAGPLLALPAAEIAAGDVVLRRVEARGHFAANYTLFIDNRMSHGVPGYHVITPLRIDGSDRHVLVNRGWIAAAPDRRTLPQVVTPPGPQLVTGLAVVPNPRQFELSTRIADGNVWQNLTIERFRATVPIAIQPVVIQQDSETADGLRREWAEPGPGADRNYGYAFQWFALAATILIYYLVTHVRNARKNAP